MKRSLTWTIFLVCLAAGCTTARAPRYYRLNLTPVATQANAAAIPATILVGRLSAPRILRDDRVVYGMSDVELGVDEYHRWTEAPTEMIEQLLVEQLRRSGQYKSVQRISSTARGDYLLRGHLTSLNEVDDPAGLKARFTIQLELFDQKSGGVVWTDNYTHDEPVEKKSVTAIVEGLQKNVNEGISQLTGNLAQYFASHLAK
ncbi:MAG TPA: ABC-type transport auxiliary lipoprotein family protein [Candidatus Acidoferrum sp.]|jgi:ABC-type uncharacterized transport system auxiliary subunit